MAVKQTQRETEQVYFCSFTCVDWLNLFEITNLYDKIYDWLNLLVDRKHQVLGFVILPNHIHLLIYVQKGKDSINSILSNGKRFLAYEVVKRLEDTRQSELLDRLASYVSEEERKRNKKHRVFEPSSDIKPCYSEKFIEQKLTYIHHNPVQGKWQLAKTFTEYPHSSAAFYELNVQHQNLNLIHYKDCG
jgi:REP element-mobilizing transposase RayT